MPSLLNGVSRVRAMCTSKSFIAGCATPTCIPLATNGRTPDLHTARNEWKNTVYPVVPGHEIVGRVVQVGREVKTFNVGDLAGVGCMVDACGVCPDCQEGLEPIVFGTLIG